MLLPSMKLVRARNVVVAAGMAGAVAVAAAVVTGAVAVAAIAAAAAADAGNAVTKECFFESGAIGWLRPIFFPRGRSCESRSEQCHRKGQAM